jgi:DNA-directed RNA polymerase sigma subunit (sigma70/sigma32)
MTDEQLVARWQKNRDLVALSKLRMSTQRIVRSQTSKFRNSPVPMAVIESKADELLVKAADTYKPQSGAQFKTHLFNHLRRLDRFVKQRSNIAYIPEGTASKITAYNNARDLLTSQKGRAPTPAELADHLSWPLTEVNRLNRSVRLDIPSSAIGGHHQMDLTDARHQQLLHDIVHELTPDEKKVFDHIMGWNGKKKSDSGREISFLTGFSQAKVSNIRKRIARKMEPHL